MSELKIYRRRYIPFETIDLKDDIVVFRDEERLITTWDVLRPKETFDHGVSCYFLRKGWKVSKFLNKKQKLVYYYCDIIDVVHNEEENSYLFCDLLVDVIVYEDGYTKVVDLAELADGLEEGVIDPKMVKDALRKTEALLDIIYRGEFETLTRHLEVGVNHERRDS